MRSRSSFVAVLALAAVGTLGCPSPSTATGAGRPVAGAEAHRLVAAGAVLVDVLSSTFTTALWAEVPLVSPAA